MRFTTVLNLSYEIFQSSQCEKLRFYFVYFCEFEATDFVDVTKQHGYQPLAERLKCSVMRELL